MTKFILTCGKCFSKDTDVFIVKAPVIEEVPGFVITCNNCGNTTNNLELEDESKGEKV